MRAPILITLGLVLAGCSPSTQGDEANKANGAYLVYVTNEQSGDISVIDPEKREVIARLSIGKRPRGLAASPDGRLLYVAVSGSPAAPPGIDESKLPPPDKRADGIAVIDLASRKLVRTLRGISDPEQIAISPDGKRLYVASEDTGQVLILSSEGNVLHKLQVGGEPEGVAVSADGSTILATSEEDHSLAIIKEGREPAVTARVIVGERPRNAAFLPGNRAIVPGELDASLSIVDLKAAKVVRTIKLAENDRPMGVDVMSNGLVVVTTGRGGRLLVVDPRDKAAAKPVVASFVVGQRPWGVALSPDGKLAFTANGPGNDVTIVDLTRLQTLGSIPVGSSPWGVAAIRK